MLECEGAAERTGLYYTCINSYLAAEEVAYIVNDSTARVVVTSQAKREVAAQLPAMCPNVERWLIADTDDPPPGVRVARAGHDALSGRARWTTSGSAPRCSIRRGRPGGPRGSCGRSPISPPSEALPLLEGLEAAVAASARGWCT